MTLPERTREATLTPRRELWHAAGRTARQARLRGIAQMGLLCSAPVLLLGAVVWRLLAGRPGLDGLGRPLAYVLDPACRAYECGCDASLFGYLLWQWALLTVLWGFFGGALHRLAAAELTQGRREAPEAARAFARSHWRSFAGARLALLAGAALPVLAAVLLATGGRVDGWLGGVLLALVTILVVLLAVVAVLVGSACLVGAFLTGPTVACEDSDTFDALSRTFGYAAAGLPRLCLVRLWFFLGVLLGATWRLALTAGVIVVTLACLRLGAGEGAMTRIEAVLGAQGTPFDAQRLGLTFGDYLAAAALAAVLFVLVLRWMADLVSRIHCAQTAAYLVLRHEIDRVPPDVLRTAPSAPTFRTAEEAGFVETGRIGSDGGASDRGDE